MVDPPTLSCSSPSASFSYSKTKFDTDNLALTIFSKLSYDVGVKVGVARGKPKARILV